MSSGCGRPARPRSARRRRRRTLAAALAAALAVGVCWPGVASAGGTTEDPATASLGSMSLDQQVGQVFMVGAPATGATAATVSAIRDRHVGNVILTGRSTAGVATTAGVTAGLQGQVTGAATAGVRLLVATDQEGGAVQVLQGPGFSAIPSALQQGATAPAVLRSQAASWGGQLAAAGVDVNLAPVLDTVPSPQAAAGNPPIGAFDREYGYTPATVSSHGGAFAAGMSDGGVLATAKHFPGLGRVTGNTDTQAGVTDRVTTPTDPYLAPFADAVHAGIPMVMVSTAVYALIDAAHPAAFSATVVQGLLRGSLGFRGVVVSDDLGNAAQVAAWSPGDRAVQFLQAGGDLVLTVDPGVLPAMYDAVLARARSDTAFRTRVQEAALRVLELKAGHGLLPVPGPLFLLGNTLGGVASTTFLYGDAGDVALVGDWNGDGTDTLAVRRGNVFYLRNSNTSGPADQVVAFGDPGDVALVGDWNGDGTDTLAVRRGTVFYVGNSPDGGTADAVVQFGNPGDPVLVGDWDGNRTDTFAVRRPAS